MRTIDLAPLSLFMLLFGFIFFADELHIPLLPALVFIALLIAITVVSMWVKQTHPTKSNSLMAAVSPTESNRT